MTKRGTSKAAAEERRARFVQVYVSKGENGTRAYLEVWPNVTDGTAAVEAHRLLKDPNIQRAIQERRQQLLSKYSLDADRVYRELARMGYFSAKQLFDEAGNPKTPQDLDDDTAAAICAVEIEQGENGSRITRWRPFDKLQALKEIVQILRLRDRPPPPPPDDEGRQVSDPRETARRMAYLLRAGAAAEERAEAKPSKPAKKKLTIPA